MEWGPCVDGASAAPVGRAAGPRRSCRPDLVALVRAGVPGQRSRVCPVSPALP